jgi:hypothetical protein
MTLRVDLGGIAERNRQKRYPLESISYFLTSLPRISLWTTGHLSEFFKPRGNKGNHFT